MVGTKVSSRTGPVEIGLEEEEPRSQKEVQPLVGR